MKMTITAKKMQIPQNFTEYAEKRLNSKLNKFFGEEADAKITMATHKNLIVIELTVDYNNMKYRAEQSAVDKEDALDAAIDKIIRQIRRNKTRVEKKLKDPHSRMWHMRTLYRNPTMRLSGTRSSLCIRWM